MKELIRQILREYTESKVTITEISPDSPLLKQIISEDKTPYSFYDSNDNLIYTRNVVSDLTQHFINYYNYDGEKGVGFCIYNENNECERLFKLGRVTDHFAYRVYRLSDPKYRNSTTLVNPGRYEGIDLFFKDINKLDSTIKKQENVGEPDKTEQKTDNSGIIIKPKKSGKNKIKSRNAWKYNSKRNFLMINFGDKFSIIIQLVKINNYIEVTFITQLKGELFNSETLQKYHPTIGVI